RSALQARACRLPSEDDPTRFAAYSHVWAEQLNLGQLLPVGFAVSLGGQARGNEDTGCEDCDRPLHSMSPCGARPELPFNIAKREAGGRTRWTALGGSSPSCVVALPLPRRGRKGSARLPAHEFRCAPLVATVRGPVGAVR